MTIEQPTSSIACASSSGSHQPLSRRGDPARHQHAHIADDPCRRIARGNADPVAALNPVSFDQPARNGARGGEHLREAQPLLTRDQEDRIAVLGAEMREIIAERGWCGGDHRHLLPAAFDHLERQRPAFAGDAGQPRLQCLIECARHRLCLSSSACRFAPL